MITGKYNAQTVEEMLQKMSEEKEKQLAQGRGQRLYKTVSGMYCEEKLRDLLSCKISDLTEYATAKPISLEDTQEIKRRAIVYLRCCQEQGVFPSNLGFAASIGYTHRALRVWRSNKPEHETSKFLQMLSEMFADVLHNMSLKNDCNSIVSIFLTKSVYDIVEPHELKITNGNEGIEPEKLDIEEIRKRYEKTEE